MRQFRSAGRFKTLVADRGRAMVMAVAPHIEDEEIVQLAVASQAKVIVCSHLYREIDARHLQVEAESRGYKGTIIVGRDLMSFVL